ncbi:vascular cell adhesion protein 1-like isoform X2 [Pristis pectinata]|uniref:vascular cell adhesion protein 1-like isoform X2 n=1 Tax=Pristis pectinata TaxID=685728 RepID=UPI00223DFCD0|nr:vascular cell adhesion protein 1-like isoform X2 [Pristis pectinata]
MDFTFSSCGGCIHLFILILRLTTKVNGFVVQIDTDSQAVEFGDSLKVTCNTTCTEAVINLEYKPGIFPNRTKGPTWVTDQFESVQKWDFTVPCFVICNSAQMTVKDRTMVVTVYNRNLSISRPPDELEVNKPYQLECIGPRVYPKNKLILTWFRGSDFVQRNTTGKAGYADEDDRLRNVLSFTASTSDDGQVYTCLAEVDLGGNTTKLITNSSVTLKTYSFPEPPRILNRGPIEVNREVTLTCEVPKVYPAEKMRVKWFQDGKERESVTNRPDPTTVRATTAWTPRETGLTELICMAKFEDYPSVPSKVDSISIDMYGELQLVLKKGSEIIVDGSASTELTIYHTVNPQAELNGHPYTCEAELRLQLHSNPIVKRQSATLNVQYSPKEALISKNQVWIEGQSQILTCRADANPAPHVHWTKDRKTIGSGETLHIPSVQLGDGGQYVCNVSNDIGSIYSSHYAEILYKPQNTTISVNNETVSGFSVFIRADDEVTMTCHSSGNPQPTLEWEGPNQGSKLDTDPPGVLYISRATSGHYGIYKCRARNEHGTDEKQVEIKMKDDIWILLLIILCTVILILLIVALVWFLINRARKTGQYKVLNAIPHKNPEIPNGYGHQENFPLQEVNSDNNHHPQTSSTNTCGIAPIGSTQITQ